MHGHALLEIISLIVSILAIIFTVITIIQAIVIRNRTKKENDEQFTFIANLVMYSSADPEAVANKLQEYRKSGVWGPVAIKRLKDGKLNFAFTPQFQPPTKN
ncbi:MAG: hypothetical protein ABSG90_05585 [Dehalococcoidia bacterium]|jgi:flagellar basal body-associated protein FliL